MTSCIIQLHEAFYLLLIKAPKETEFLIYHKSIRIFFNRNEIVEIFSYIKEISGRDHEN